MHNIDLAIVSTILTEQIQGPVFSRLARRVSQPPLRLYSFSTAPPAPAYPTYFLGVCYPGEEQDPKLPEKEDTIIRERESQGIPKQQY